jgi:hypothetical protein
MKTNSVVHTLHDKDLDREFNSIANDKRETYNQCLGTIKEHHDSHGLCFVVVFLDGMEVPYDPSELTVITEPEIVNSVKARAQPRVMAYVDEFKVAGRGLIVLVRHEKPLPEINDKVRINGVDYLVRGLELGGRETLGLLVKEMT